MNSNLFSIERFVQKKERENFFARNRKPLCSSFQKGTYVFESFDELRAQLELLEKTFEVESHNSELSNSITCGNSL